MRGGESTLIYYSGDDSQSLSHYGRLGMHWYKHIFGQVDGRAKYEAKGQKQINKLRRKGQKKIEERDEALNEEKRARSNAEVSRENAQRQDEKSKKSWTKFTKEIREQKRDRQFEGADDYEKEAQFYKQLAIDLEVQSFDALREATQTMRKYLSATKDIPLHKLDENTDEEIVKQYEAYVKEKADIKVAKVNAYFQESHRQAVAKGQEMQKFYGSLSSQKRKDAYEHLEDGQNQQTVRYLDAMKRKRAPIPDQNAIQESNSTFEEKYNAIRKQHEDAGNRAAERLGVLNDYNYEPDNPNKKFNYDKYRDAVHAVNNDPQYKKQSSDIRRKAAIADFQRMRIYEYQLLRKKGVPSEEAWSNAYYEALDSMGYWQMYD